MSNLKHWQTPEYFIWSAMVQRCHSPNNPSFKDYGAKGVTVCLAWRKSFKAFICDIGPRPDKSLSIDRINTYGNYEPGNVRWATRKQQNRNQRNNRRLTFNGETHCVSEWDEILGFPRNGVARRLSKGWSVERALSTPYNYRSPINHNAKLTEDDIRAIRSRAATESQHSLARTFGVNQSQISRIVSGQRYRQVEGLEQEKQGGN